MSVCYIRRVRHAPAFVWVKMNARDTHTYTDDDAHTPKHDVCFATRTHSLVYVTFFFSRVFLCVHVWLLGVCSVVPTRVHTLNECSGMLRSRASRCVRSVAVTVCVRVRASVSPRRIHDMRPRWCVCSSRARGRTHTHVANIKKNTHTRTHTIHMRARSRVSAVCLCVCLPCAEMLRAYLCAYACARARSSTVAVRRISRI